MKIINGFDNAKIQKMKDDFQRVMVSSFEIWDKHNFRIPSKSGRGTINTAVLETVCNYLSSKTDAYIKKYKQRIKNNYDKLIKDEAYLDAVTRSTGDTTRVLNRFRIVHEILDKGIHL
jgi:hypothetical protein